VVDAAVIGIPSKEWGETPLGFVVAAGGESWTSLQSALAPILSWAKPSASRRFKQLDELPRSHIGKILKTALRELVSET